MQPGITCSQRIEAQRIEAFVVVPCGSEDLVRFSPNGREALDLEIQIDSWSND